MMSFLIAMLLLLPGVTAGTDASVVTAADSAAAMKIYDSPDKLLASATSYEVAVLKRGPRWSERRAMAPANIEHWRSLAKEGKLVGLVRVVDPGEIVGLVIFKNLTAEEMKKEVAGAPAVRDGRLIVDIQKVWGLRGLGEKWVAQAATGTKAEVEKYYGAVFTKGKSWSEKSDDAATRSAVAEQVKWLYDVHKTGNLRFFAALEDMKQNTRSIAIVKAATKDEAVRMLSDSPNEESGWLKLHVKPVEVPAGMLP